MNKRVFEGAREQEKMRVCERERQRKRGRENEGETERSQMHSYHCNTLQHTATHCNIVKREREKGLKCCLVRSKVTLESQNRPTHVRRDQQISNEVDDVAFITSQEIVWQLCRKLFSTTSVFPKKPVE